MDAAGAALVTGDRQSDGRASRMKSLHDRIHSNV
jgi:hypothetical protein